MDRCHSKNLGTTLRLEMKFSNVGEVHCVLGSYYYVSRGDAVASLFTLLSFTGHSVPGWTDV